MPYTRKTKKYFNYITVYSDSTNAPLMLFGCINYNWAIGSYACDFDCDAFAQSEWTLRHKIVTHNTQLLQFIFDHLPIKCPRCIYGRKNIIGLSFPLWIQIVLQARDF